MMNARAFLEKINAKLLWLIFFSSLVLTFLFISVLFPPFLAQFLPTGFGLNEFKFAWTKERMDAIISAWNSYDPGLIETMKMVHVVDFFFMGAYGFMLWSGLVIIYRFARNNKCIQKFFYLLTYLPFIAVVLDVIEGIHIFVMLGNPMQIMDFNAYSAALSTTICIWIINFCIIIFFIGLIIDLILFLKHRGTSKNGEP
ncbi:MAG: hypothetical protein ACFFCS_02825 [Candidatus Hodarchaeota archaeon]